MHQLADLSSYLSTSSTHSSSSPFAALFVHPSHALTPAEQTAIYGGAFAVHDPPLRPMPGKAYADGRNEAYEEFADGLEALVKDKMASLDDVPDTAGLKEEYQSLLETSTIFRQTDDHVNFSLMDPTSSTAAAPSLETMLHRTRTLLTTLQARQEKARAAVEGLRIGFDWGMRIDPTWSAQAEAEAQARKAQADGEDEDEDEDEDEEDGEGDEDADEDDDDEMEEVVPAAVGGTATLSRPAETNMSNTTVTKPPDSAGAQSQVISLLDDDEDDDLFGENDSPGTAGGGSAAVGAGTGSIQAVPVEDDDEDEEMDQVA
ncbi:hypothetical protein QFC19_009094 [Naganishia cerealis]|uniref:Uncharacterized protein n=1 Tax=Naganishia cerealis TaxID=610337 RepID=A0ACC2UXE8_9TREE|nr:hypothetical protein QFC19_009094 [Naganishia cerealis]